MHKRDQFHINCLLYIMVNKMRDETIHLTILFSPL